MQHAVCKHTTHTTQRIRTQQSLIMESLSQATKTSVTVGVESATQTWMHRCDCTWGRLQQKWDIDSSVCDLGVSDPGPTACFSKASISLCTAKHQEWYSAAVDSQTRMVMAQVLSNAFRLSLQCMDGPVFLVLDASSEKTVFDSHELSIWPHDLVAVLSWLMIQMSDGFEHHTIWHQVIHHESTTMSPFSVGNPVFLIYAHDLSETAEVELIKHFPVQFLDSLTFQF